MTKTKWVLDPAHSEISFKVRHMMIASVTGNFENFELSALSDGDDFSNASVSLIADVNSVHTKNEQRDIHLKSADFFDSVNYPHIRFEAENVSLEPGENKLNGNLTIRNTTLPVTVHIEYTGTGIDPYGNTKAGFSIEAKVKRKDFGLTWNVPLEGGGVLVSEEVKIIGEFQLVKQP